MTLQLQILRRCLILLGLTLCPGLGLLSAQTTPAVNHPAAQQAIQPITPRPATKNTSTSTTTATVPSTTTYGQTPVGYVVSPGDTLDISVYDSPDLSVKATVTEQGEVYLPLVKRVHVGGLTIEKAQTQIEQALQTGGFINDPLVRVAVTDYAHGVDMLGEISKPGTYPVSGSKRLLQLLTEAGGTTANAGSEVTIRRATDGHVQTVPLSSDPTNLLLADTWVNQGDTVIVPKAGVVYVVGEVNQPSGFAMQDRTDYTVLKLIAMAHGTTKFAKTSEVKIVRKAATGSLTEIPVPLNKIVALKSPDVTLQPDDIVFVPTSKAKTTGAKTAEIAASLITGVAIIGFERF